MVLMLLLLTQSHLEFGVVVAAGRHQRYYNYNYDNNDNNDIASRRTTATSSVTSAASSAFVFRDCGKQDTQSNVFREPRLENT